MARVIDAALHERCDDGLRTCCRELQDTDQASSVDLRNRAYTLLDPLVGSLREAGCYAFRQDALLLKRFSSPFLRKKGKRARSLAAQRAEAELVEA